MMMLKNKKKKKKKTIGINRPTAAVVGVVEVVKLVVAQQEPQ
jgi:hypothetical protein